MALTQPIATTAPERAMTEVACNPDSEQVLPDGGYENDVTADVATGDGPTKKKKKSKPKSQKAAVRHTSCQLLSLVC